MRYVVKVNGKERVFTSLIEAQEYLSDIFAEKDIVDYRSYEVKLISEHYVEVK